MKINPKGFSLVEILIVAGLSGIVLLMATSLMKVSDDVTSESSFIAALDEAKYRVIEVLKNETAFKNTLKHPTNASVFACVNGNTPCDNAGGSFNLYDENNNLVKEVARVGMNDGLSARKGAPCSGFNATSGNNACPAQITAQWTPRCPPAPQSCINPTVEVSIDFKTKFASNSITTQINTSSYSFTMTKSNITASLQANCVRVGGTFLPDGSCKMKYQGSSCPPNTYIVGFDSQGSMLCKPLIHFQCPKGEVLLGLDGAGKAFCGPGCTDPSGSASGSIW